MLASVKKWRTRLLVSFLVALFLPFPGPHISDYIPVGWTLIRGGLEAWRGSDTDLRGFYLIVSILLAVYTVGAFGVLSLIEWIRSRRTEPTR